MAETNDTKPAQPEPRPEADLIKLMSELCIKLQPLTIAERRRVISSVATMLGINSSGSTQPRPAQRPAQQPPRNNGGR